MLAIVMFNTVKISFSLSKLRGHTFCGNTTRNDIDNSLVERRVIIIYVSRELAKKNFIHVNLFCYLVNTLIAY